MPLSGWIMFAYFWAVILTGAGLAFWGWRDALSGQYGGRYRPTTPPERRREPAPGEPELPEEWRAPRRGR